MKRFILTLLAFFLTVFGLACVLDVVVSKGMMKMEDYRFMSWDDLSKGEASSDLLIMGNSRGLSHFEPWTITDSTGLSTYNLGVGGYSITVQTLKYRYYRLHNQKPKVIVQQVDYYTMRDDYIPKNHQSEQFMPLVYDKGIRSELKRCGYTWLDLNCPMYRYFGYQQVIKNGVFEFLHIKHYVSDPSRLGHHYERGEIDLARNEDLEPQVANMNPKSQSIFEAFLADCQKENILVVLVNSPTYKLRTERTIGLEEVNEYFSNVAEKYGAVYMNYEGDPICETPSLFSAAVHLNPEGTHRFSTSFAQDLNRILLAD